MITDKGKKDKNKRTVIPNLNWMKLLGSIKRNSQNRIIKKKIIGKTKYIFFFISKQINK